MGALRQEILQAQGIPSMELEEIVLNMDEFEAFVLPTTNICIRKSRRKENISRQTFGRI